MFGPMSGVLLGVLVGVRHAFEPDHLAAVSTLLTDSRGARRGALLGAIWGLGHTLSLLIVGGALVAAGVFIPPHLTAAFEIAVAIMLIALGVRAVTRAWREGNHGPVVPHAHAGAHHVHPAPTGGHLHIGQNTLAWRPLAVGLVHGLAGSGAMTALACANLAGNGARVAFIALFGLGSIVGMALVSAVAGASLARLRLPVARQRALGMVAGIVSILVGMAWGIPLALGLA